MYRRCGSGLFLFSSASLVVIFFSTDVVCGPPRLAQASAGQDNCNNLSRQSKILLSVVVISSVVITSEETMNQRRLTKIYTISVSEPSVAESSQNVRRVNK